MDYKIFHDYKIYSDGTIINKHGKTLAKRERDGRYEIRLMVDGKRKKYNTIIKAIRCILINIQKLE